MKPTIFYRIAILVICLFWTGSIQADGTTVKDSSAIDIRLFSTERFESISNDERFDYRTETVPRSDFWERFWNWINGRRAATLPFTESESFWRIASIIFVVGIIVFVIIRLIDSHYSGLFFGGNKKFRLDFAAAEEDIHKADFQALIAAAETAKDYRQAIRMRYLYALKLLSNKGLIAWQQEKTNRDYLIELRGAAIRHPFQKMTYLFDNIIYGDFLLTRQQYFSMVGIFENFNRNLSPTSYEKPLAGGAADE